LSASQPEAHRTGPDVDAIRNAPKVLLHDHLDGGVRAATVAELAQEIGYRALPTADPQELAAWFQRGADRKSLELYLEGFAHTLAVM
jgi:adenosine deaminase